MTNTDLRAEAKEYAKQFMIGIPVDQYERDQNESIQEALAQHFQAGAVTGYAKGKAERAEEFEDLQRCNAGLVIELSQLKTQLEETQQQRNYWDKRFHETKEKLAERDAEIAALRAEVKRLTTAFQVTTVDLTLAEQALKRERERNSMLVEALERIAKRCEYCDRGDECASCTCFDEPFANQIAAEALLAAKQDETK